MLRGLKAGRSAFCWLVPPPAAGGVAAGGAAWAMCGAPSNPPSKATAEDSQAKPPTAARAVETAKIFKREDILGAPERVLGNDSPCLSVRAASRKRARPALLFVRKL